MPIIANPNIVYSSVDFIPGFLYSLHTAIQLLKFVVVVLVFDSGFQQSDSVVYVVLQDLGVSLVLLHVATKHAR